MLCRPVTAWKVRISCCHDGKTCYLVVADNFPAQVYLTELDLGVLADSDAALPSQVEKQADGSLCVTLPPVQEKDTRTVSDSARRKMCVSRLIFSCFHLDAFYICLSVLCFTFS